MSYYQDVQDWLERVEQLVFRYWVANTDGTGRMEEYQGKTLFTSLITVAGWNTSKEAIVNTMRKCKALNNS